jgi:hypothetical protein
VPVGRLQRHGYGLTAGLFTIDVPVDKEGAEWSSDLVDASRGLAREIADSVNEGYLSYKPDGSRELVLRLVLSGTRRTATSSVGIRSAARRMANTPHT